MVSVKHSFLFALHRMMKAKMNLKCVGIIYFVLNLGWWMMNNRFVRGKHILTEVILPAVSVANYIIIEKASVRCLPPVLPRSLANQTS